MKEDVKFCVAKTNTVKSSTCKSFCICMSSKTLKFNSEEADILNINKKVLLGNRKRHTDQGVSSTPSAVLSRRGVTLSLPNRGVPHPCWLGGYPVMIWGNPHASGKKTASFG